MAEEFGGRGDDDSWLLAGGVPFADRGEKLLRFAIGRDKIVEVQKHQGVVGIVGLFVFR